MDWELFFMAIGSALLFYKFDQIEQAAVRAAESLVKIDGNAEDIAIRLARMEVQVAEIRDRVAPNPEPWDKVIGSD